MEKCEYFIKELQYINNNDILYSLKTMINLLPDYFFHMPASTTGKYHPAFALGDGGLLRHTKSAVRIAYEILNNETLGTAFNGEEKDLIIMAVLLHDGLKSGLIETQYTQVNHPLLMADYIRKNASNLKLNSTQLNLVCRMIETHMGPFNKDYKGNTVLPVPTDRYQKFVHMCDYLASKKFLNINFNGNEIVE